MNDHPTPPNPDATSSVPAAPPPRRPATPTIVVLNTDLFFGVRIGNTLRDAGYQVTFARDTHTFLTHLSTTPTPALGLVDLAAAPDWSAIFTHTAQSTEVPILVFGPHKDVDGFRAAKAAGITRIVSNGDFHRDMLGLIRRYARP